MGKNGHDRDEVTARISMPVQRIKRDGSIIDSTVSLKKIHVTIGIVIGALTIVSILGGFGIQLWSGVAKASEVESVETKAGETRRQVDAHHEQIIRITEQQATMKEDLREVKETNRAIFRRLGEVADAMRDRRRTRGDGR